MTFGREADESTSLALIDRFLERGGNLIDTADRYGAGESEAIIGRALRGRRDDVVLATKFRWPTGAGPNNAGASRRHIMLAVEASLRRLQTDWIDLYQIHSWDPNTSLEETVSTLNDLVRAGKVRYLGASNFAAWQLAKALGLSARHGWEPFAAVQPQ
jgi:aryl-alcohol dehydrogenase-like predicted oxidoreductase